MLKNSLEFLVEISSLYQEVILDHYKNPHHKGISANHAIQVHHNNPSCGDEIDLALTIDNGNITNLSWDGHGCSISMASASIMSDLLDGKTEVESETIMDGFTAMLQSKGKDKGDEALLEDGVALSGVSQYPARIKCALLAWMAFKDAKLQLKGRA